jgi:hypothetical protein
VLLAHVVIDPGFGKNGIAPVGGRNFVHEVADGKILAVSEGKASRLNPNGTVDSSFVDSHVPGGTWNYSDVVLGQKRVLIAAAGLDSVRYVRAVKLSNGTADKSFGTGGLVSLKFTAAKAGAQLVNATLWSMIGTPDGGVLVGEVQTLREGAAPDADQVVSVLLKLDAAGKTDSSFGSGGQKVLESTDGSGPELAADPQGGFLVVGGAGITRYLGNGSPDPSFGKNGVVKVSDFDYLGPEPRFIEAKVQPDGKTILRFTAQRTGEGSDPDPSEYFDFDNFARLNRDGTLDSTYGERGVTSFNEYLSPIVSDWMVDGQGRVLATVVVDESLGLFRLTPTGQREVAFDDRARGIAFPAGLARGASAVATDHAGNILVGATESVQRIVQGERVSLGAKGVIKVVGRDQGDTLNVKSADGRVIVIFDRKKFSFKASRVKGISIGAGEATEMTNDINVLVDLDTEVFAKGKSVIRTSGGNDRIVCNTGGATIDSGAGNDAIHGTDSADSIFGGAGNDKVFAGLGGDWISGGSGNDKIWGGPDEPDDGEYFRQDFNNTIIGDSGNDTIRGEIANDQLSGSKGNDVIYGAEGDDEISGGDGDDRLYGGLGKDTVEGGNGNDRLYDDNKATYYVPSSPDVLHGGAGDDWFNTDDAEKDSVFGDEGKDTVMGDAGDVLAGVEVRL